MLVLLTGDVRCSIIPAQQGSCLQSTNPAEVLSARLSHCVGICGRAATWRPGRALILPRPHYSSDSGSQSEFNCIGCPLGCLGCLGCLAALTAGFIGAIQLAGLTITYILSLIYSAESDYSPAREVKPVRQADSATRQGGRAEPGLANLVL